MTEPDLKLGRTREVVAEVFARAVGGGRATRANITEKVLAAAVIWAASQASQAVETLGALKVEAAGTRAELAALRIEVAGVRDFARALHDAFQRIALNDREQDREIENLKTRLPAKGTR